MSSAKNDTGEQFISSEFEKELDKNLPEKVMNLKIRIEVLQSSRGNNFKTGGQYQGVTGQLNQIRQNKSDNQGSQEQKGEINMN